MKMRMVILGVTAFVGGACGERQLGPGPMTGAGGAGNDMGAPPIGNGGMPGGASRGGSSCWTGSVPPEPQPAQPQSTVAASCAASATTSWGFPDSRATNVDVDDNGLLTGRWVTCGASGFTSIPHAGVEFAGNGRWRLLTTDASGALVGMDPVVPGSTGYYYVLDTGQTDLRGEDFQSGAFTFFITFSPGMDALRFGGGDPSAPASIYARTTPSPSNGDDNAPAVSDGRCSMVGTWDVPANNATPYAPPAWITFDANGGFVGGPQDQTVCSGYSMYGTYQLLPGLFELTTNVGMGLCAWWFDAGYPATFDADCTHVTLMQYYDNCTGGRGYLNGTTTLARRSL
jgi:hypothetical protein